MTVPPLNVTSETLPDFISTYNGVFRNTFVANLNGVVVIDPVNVIDVRFSQSSKASASMESTEVGMVTDLRLEQSSKARRPMEVTEVGMVTDLRLEQPLKT